MSHSETLAPGHYHHIEPEGAYHASKLGMWLFLATEVHLFTALFCAFAVFRWKYHEIFVESARTLDWRLGALNTAVLLTSSYFMVRGVDRAQHGDNKGVSKWLFWTQVCAFIFLIVKSVEYGMKFSHHISISTNVFYALYFAMTSIHGLHVIIGMGAIYWLQRLAKVNRFSTTYYTPVEVIGLYWHLVDAVWIFLFPIVYLAGGIQFGGPGAVAH